MRFQVPQFIEVESKIFGPLTLKQFMYLAGGGGAIFLLYVLLPLWLTIIFAIPVAIFVVALAFFTYNDRPFIKMVESALNYAMSAKFYIWKKEEPKKREEIENAKKVMDRQDIFIPKLTKSKLSDLAWSLDIKEKVKNE